MPDKRKQELNAMNTKELRAFLERDLEQDSDPDLTLLAAQLLAQREKEPSGDVDAAWKQFCEDYRPFQSDAAPLLEWEETPQENADSKQRHHRRWRPYLLSSTAAAAVLAVVLVHGGAQNTAMPEDPGRELMKWNARYLTQGVVLPSTTTAGKATTKTANTELMTAGATSSTASSQQEWSYTPTDPDEEESEETAPALIATASVGGEDEPEENPEVPAGDVEDAGSAGTQGEGSKTPQTSDDNTFGKTATPNDENTTIEGVESAR